MVCLLSLFFLLSQDCKFLIGSIAKIYWRSWVILRYERELSRRFGNELAKQLCKTLLTHHLLKLR